MPVSFISRAWYVESVEIAGFEEDGQPEFRPITTGPFWSRREANDFAAEVGGEVVPGRSYTAGLMQPSFEFRSA